LAALEYFLVECLGTKNYDVFAVTKGKRNVHSFKSENLKTNYCFGDIECEVMNWIKLERHMGARGHL
jgi:hypothetical protein